MLNLLDEASKYANVKIKTPSGITNLRTIMNLIMQGETMLSILYTGTMAKLSDDSKTEPYKYRNEVEVPKLGFVDDIVDINKCGQQTKDMNDFTNNEINKRKLQCHQEKCHRLHVGKRKECETLMIDSWKVKQFKSNGKIEEKDVHEGKEIINTLDNKSYLGMSINDKGSNR